MKLNWREQRQPPEKEVSYKSPSPILAKEIRQAVDHVSTMVKEHQGVLEWFRENDPESLNALIKQTSLVDAEWERAGNEPARREVKRFIALFEDMLRKYRVAIKTINAL